MLIGCNQGPAKDCNLSPLNLAIKTGTIVVHLKIRTFVVAVRKRMGGKVVRK
jgi:hypothetical protein